MNSPFLGELLGTLILILLGDGVVAAFLWKKSKAESSGWMVITAGWAFAVMCGLITAVACGSRAAHLNPAVTIGFAVRSGDFTEFLPFVAAQMLGALGGAVIMWIHYFPHWRETPEPTVELSCFCSIPAIWNFASNLVSEIIATFVLVFVVGAIFSRAVARDGIASGLGPYLVGSLVGGVGLSPGGPTGYAVNPARDLPPGLAHAMLPIAGKGGSDGSYARIAIMGPWIGGALAGLAMRVMHSSETCVSRAFYRIGSAGSA
jgi:glycerol uptake facilitator protein